MKNHASSPSFVLLLSALIALPALAAPVSAGQFTLTAFFIAIAGGLGAFIFEGLLRAKR